MTEPTNEQTLPEMQPGSNGMYSISAADGIKMGPAVLQAFMQKLREAAELAQLEVKVEPLKGILMIWWYPKEESTFLTDVLQHMSAVPTGSMKAERKLLFADDVKNLEQLVEFFKMVSQTRAMHIEIRDTLDTDYLEIVWRPSREILGESDGTLDNQPDDNAMPPGDQMHWDSVDEDEYGQRG